MKLIVKIALGVVMTFILIATAYSLIETFAIQKLNKSFQHRAILQKERIIKQKEDKIKAQEQQRFLNIRKNQKIKEAQRLAWKKKQAWYAWYNEREPEGCDNWQSERHMVECINHKMDSKVKFEKMWHSQKNTIKK